MANPEDSDFFSADLSAGTPVTGKVYTGGLADINPTAQNKAAIAPLDVNMNTPITQRGSALPPMANHESIVSALDFMRNNHQAEVINPMQGAKSFQFGAGMDHIGFERYYQHGLYDELGFNAARDNESLYNENTSLSMEMGRAAGQWGSQFRLGMMDAFGWGGVTDQSAARMMEENMAIGSSSKGGATGFMTNQFLNTGYTFGILGELGLEYLAELGVTALTGGYAAPAAGAVGVARTGKALWKIKNAYQASKNLAKTLGSLKDMSKAKKYFTQAAKSTGRFLNPLENTTDFIRNAGKLENFREMDKLAKTSSGFLSFYKDVRNARIAFGESSLEGGMVQNEMIGDLYDEFVHTHGRNPNENELASIRDTAAKAGATTTWANLPTIFFSNKIVLNRAFTKMNPFKKVGSDLLEKGAAGKLMFNRKAAKDAFEVVENNWKGFLKSARNPRAYGNVGMNYFKANFAEGLQEVAQEVIAGSSKDYYTAQFEGTPLKGGAWAAISDNVSKQFSGQGFETFMSGFLMGGMIQPVTMAPSYLKAGVSRFKDPAKYKAQKAEGMAELNKKANTLNEMFNDPMKYFNQDLANTEAQHKYDKAAEQAEVNGDTKAYHDIKDAGLYDHVYTALRAKRMDTFIERLEDMRSAEEADIKAEYGDLSVEEYQAKINKSIKRAKEIQARFDFVEKKHTNPFNPSAYEKGSLQYIKSAINHVGWQAAQKEFIFNGHAFDRTLERMSSIMGEANADLKLKNTSINDFNILFDGTLSQVQAEIDTLGKELDALPEEKLTKEQVKRRKYKSQKRDFLKNYAEAMQGVMETTSGEVGGQVTPEGNKSLKKAYKAFERYLKHVAGENKEYVFDENIQQAFNKLMDYQMLSMDARNLEKAVNMMTSPKAFMERAERLAKQHEDAFAKRDQEIEKALKEWMKVVETNRLLQLLSDINVFFDPKEIKPLLDEGKMPGQFYQLKTKDGGTGIKREIQKNSVQHRKAVNIIKNYVQDIMDIEIPEAEGTSEYQTKTRPKLANDKRTYNDLAEQFGFDPAAESSEVPLAQVLESIINSKFATHREKALAENLLRLAKEGEKVTFVKNSSKPGTYSPTEQTVIDARYNSREYRNAGTPIEFVILHEEIHRRTVEGLSEDANFRRSIKSLMAAVDQFMSAPENQAKYGSKPYYGMKNPAEFVAEAMANQEFQTLLSEISYADQNRTGSTWTNFVDEVLKFFRRMFGRKADGTVMNAAFDIITTKIDSDFGAPTALQLDQAKVKRIEAARKAELEQYAGNIIEKVEDFEATNEEGETTYVQIRHAADGSRKAYMSNEKNRYGNAVDPEPFSISSEQSTEDYMAAVYDTVTFGEFTKVGERTAEEANLDKRLKKINAKYDKQIEELKAAAAQEAIPEAGGTSTEPQILPTTPFAEIRDQHPELMKQLVQAYKDDNASLVRRNLEPHEENWEMMSDEQIMNSGFFRNTFIKRLSPARKVFTAYNRTNGRTATPVTPPVQTPAAPPVAPLASSQTVSDEEYQAFVDTGAVSEARIDSIAKKIKAGTELNERETAIFTDKTAEVNSRLTALAQIEAADIPTQWNRALKQQVLDLGYTEEERRAMDVSDAWVLVQEGLTKEERNEIELADQNAARAELEEQRQSILTRIDEEIAGAENYEELLAVEAELLAEFASNPQLRAAAGLTGPAIEAKIQAKKDELAFNFTFEDFVVGETVIMNNRARTKVKINNITEDTIFGTDINDPTKRYRIRRGTETERVKYKHSRAMAESTVTPETVTPESTELSNETIETGRGLNNQESIQEDIAAGRNATDEDLDSDLLDDVNECE